MDLLLSAIREYGVPPTNKSKIEHLREKLYTVLNGNTLNSDEDGVVTSDPLEDCDDILMIKYILMKKTGTGTVWIILSGGLHTPHERFAHLKNVFPELKDLEFGQLFNNVIFLEDGIRFVRKISFFINCGPCHSETLSSICDSLIKGGRIITVGANTDGSSSGVNQKQTDGNVLKDIVWNMCINAIRHKVSIENLEVETSRFILLPNPSNSAKMSTYSEMPESCLDDIVNTTAMFVVSRPPAKFALRVNEGNSIVDYQLFPNIMEHEGTYEFAYGLSLIQDYAKTCEGLPNAEVVATSAAIPLMITALMGGIYKKGVFGFSPTDKTAKKEIGCLTPESALVLVKYIKTKFQYFTPGYDLIAVILGLENE